MSCAALWSTLSVTYWTNEIGDRALAGKASHSASHSGSIISSGGRSQRARQIRRAATQLRAVAPLAKRMVAVKCPEPAKGLTERVNDFDTPGFVI